MLRGVASREKRPLAEWRRGDLCIASDPLIAIAMRFQVVSANSNTTCKPACPLFLFSRG